MNYLEWFYKLAEIPHGSGNTKQISDFLIDFALEKGLQSYQDDYNNVIIYKAAQNGGEDSKPVILQGHIDMVCEKEEGCDIDFTKDGLKLIENNGFLEAEGTTLGGDDGIAVAYMLSILEDENIRHPDLECLFTVDEEIGMLGAEALDKSRLMGRRLLNIDSEEEGTLLVSCAGGATVEMTIPVLRRGAQGSAYKITVAGLTGGHSGVEIDKGRANSDILLGNILKELLLADDSLRLISIEGGLKDNAIPIKASAVIKSKNIDVLEEKLTGLTNKLKEEYSETDPKMNIILEEAESEDHPLDELQNLSILMLLGELPFGVRAYSKDIEGLVQTSLNLGIMSTEKDSIRLIYSVRSSVEKEKQELIEELILMARSVGGTVDIRGSYPAWEYKKDSFLRDKMTSIYKDMFGKTMEVEAIHAGVECGIFAGALDGLDAVSFGPDILEIHTPREKLDLASAERTYKYILRLLEEL